MNAAKTSILVRRPTLAGLGALLLIVAMTAVTGADRAGAAFPGANGKIAFASDRDAPNGEYQFAEHLEIYVMNPDGSGQTRLTTNAAEDRAPAWSADGTKIAFQSQRDGNREIYVMNADGSSPMRLTTNPTSDSSPAWSPDGSKLAFTTDRDGNLEIYVMNADGSGQTNLTMDPADDFQPAWSPDGRKIAFNSARNGDVDIYVMNVDGSGVTNLTAHEGPDLSPAWSPDGSKIVFASARDGSTLEVFVMNADGSGQTRLTSTGRYVDQPAWSPDGQKIAFETFTDGSFAVFVMNADGSAPTNLTPTIGVDEGPDWQPVPNSDGDGLPDAQDPDTVATAVSGLPDSAFSTGEHARPFLNKLDEIEAMIIAGDSEQARTELQNLYRKVDGCGSTADTNDWIVDCAAQVRVRALIDDLLANLGA